MILPEHAAAYELANTLADMMRERATGMPVHQVAAVLTSMLGVAIRQAADLEYRDELLEAVIVSLRRQATQEDQP